MRDFRIQLAYEGDAEQKLIDDILRLMWDSDEMRLLIPAHCRSFAFETKLTSILLRCWSRAHADQERQKGYPYKTIVSVRHPELRDVVENDCKKMHDV